MNDIKYSILNRIDKLSKFYGQITVLRILNMILKKETLFLYL